MIAGAVAVAANQGTGDGANQVANPQFVTRIELITPPDETRYLAGVRRRAPLAADQLDPSALVDFGLQACAIRNGYVNGSRPDPISRLAQDIADKVEGLDAEDVASAATNAGEGSLCDSTVEALE